MLEKSLCKIQKGLIYLTWASLSIKYKRQEEYDGNP